MNLSLDEYRALVAKAFRGVGYPWGLTEDASWAARRLAEFDTTSPGVVQSLLTALDTTSGVRPADDSKRGVRPAPTVERPDLVRAHMPADDWTCEADALCPICVGTTLLDLGQAALENPITLGPTLSPELLAPFLAKILGSDPQSMGSDPIVLLDWESGSCKVTSDLLTFQGSRVEIASSIRMSVQRGSDPTDSGGSDASRNGRVVLETTQFRALERFAHRIYAPATDASRAGAGAGTSDND